MKKILFSALALVIVGVVAYEILIYYDNAFIYGRMRETPVIHPHEEPLLIMEPDLVPFSGGEMQYKVQEPAAIMSPLDMDEPETIQRGRVVYYTFCAQCHGKNHDGNGTVGQSFHPLPTDLRSAKVQSQPNGNIFWNISYGLAEGNGRQPPLATTIKVTDRWRVVAYVKSLGVRE